ncbi:MAG: type II secretion system protein GspI [Gammaproteobacteria bacterium]|nr:MAG: type II secretion system protein GspI [Gammaproteobacteria bacterium]
MKAASQGFTLVEVMVALAVVALTLPALILTLNQHIDSTAYLRDKSIARLVAANKLTEFRLMTSAKGALPKEKDAGQARMAGRDWYWNSKTTTTPMPGFFRTTITVAAQENGEPIFSLASFFSVVGEEPRP